MAKTAKAASLVAADMKAVTGVGAPWYTSGVHWWNGAIEILKARPTATMPTPTRVSESLIRPPSLRPEAISLKPVAAALEQHLGHPVKFIFTDWQTTPKVDEGSVAERVW